MSCSSHHDHAWTAYSMIGLMRVLIILGNMCVRESPENPSQKSENLGRLHIIYTPTLTPSPLSNRNTRTPTSYLPLVLPVQRSLLMSKHMRPTSGEYFNYSTSLFAIKQHWTPHNLTCSTHTVPRCHVRFCSNLRTELYHQTMKNNRPFTHHIQCALY